MTNEHINEAQRRAAELLHEMDETMPQGALVPKELYEEALAGWAAVIRTLDSIKKLQLSALQALPEGNAIDDAITNFCDTMRGGSS